MLIGLGVIGAVLLVFIISIISIYNSIIRLSNGYKNSFSQIDVQLQRRFELIPNLVETAKKYMSHEKETLEAVINARNNAMKSTSSLSRDPSDVSSIKEFNQAEGVLNQSMGKFMALFENYPDLKASTTMNSLMEELTSTENKVAFARQSYNDHIMHYNNGIQEFPNNIIAGIFNFNHVPQLEIENVEMRKAVKVEF